MRFFTRILDIVIPPRPTELLLRTLPSGELSSCILQRTLTLPGSLHSSVTTLSLYTESNIRASIIETKFHGNKRAAHLLGKLMASYISSSTEARPYVLIPIPLSCKRKKGRGYNQVERIAAEAVRLIPTRLTLRCDILVRARDTTPQTSLGRRSRLENLRGAFEAYPRIEPHGNYIVLDDVMTTGATLAAAISALRVAGARHIMPIAIAYQPIGNER